MVYRRFCAVIAKIIRSGHVGAWGYGWSFSLIALEEAADAEQQRLKEMAVAVRVGMGADKKEWKKFMQAGEKKKPAELSPNEEVARWKRLAKAMTRMNG